MRRIVLFLLLIMTISLVDAHGAHGLRKVRLAFQEGDLLFNIGAGYPKIPQLNEFSFLGDGITDIPPIGGGFQLSVIRYLSFGADFMFSSKSHNSTSINIDKNSKINYILAGGKVLGHYPLLFFDPYIGGGAGYMWKRHSTIKFDDEAGLYWVAILGFRLAFGEGSPIGIFAEVSYPYPLVFGGIYFRIRVF